MKKSIDKTSNRIQIPVKTKIAVWMMAIYGLLVLSFTVIMLFAIPPEGLWWVAVFLIVVEIIYLTIPCSFFKATGLSWSWLVGCLELIVFVAFINLIVRDDGFLLLKIFHFFVNAVALCFIILDKKNYFAAIREAKSQAEQI